MSRLLSTTLFVAALALSAKAADDPPYTGPALTSKTFTWGNLPYQVDTDATGRGPQFGYNICNSTTEGQTSLCQTAVLNSLGDFCLWGAPSPGSLVGDMEAAAIAWCTKTGYGTRTIPSGAITGVQFIKTPDYVQVTGHINQAMINFDANDSGGELDPHGADERGNPLGGLIFSNAWSGGNANTYNQAVQWHNFMGGNVFCLKACDPSRPNAARYCEHVFDRIGCAYNAPASYADNVFESCDGDNQDFPGVYTDASGAVQTFAQPPESLGPISTMPYDPKIPATSNCVQHKSADIFNGQPQPTTTVATTTAASSAASSKATGATGSKTQAGATKSGSGTIPASSATKSAGAAGKSAQIASVGVIVAAVVGFMGVAVGAIAA